MANVTIDDADPSIVYLPDGAWNTRNASTPCPSCTANPDITRMFDNTFHDGTFNSVPGSNNSPNVPLTATVLFNGTAVYIFCALADSSTAPDGDSDMTFFIDGVIRGTFAQTAPGIPNFYQFSVPVFSITSLSPGQHTLTIQNGHVNGTKALTMLDEIIYTAVDTISSSTSPSSSQSISSTSPVSSQSSPASAENSAKSTKKNSGVIIGPIVAIVLAAALGLGFFFWWRRRRPQSTNPQRTMIDPDAPSSTWMSEPVSIPSSHPAHSSTSDAPASFGTAAAPYSSRQAKNAVAGPSHTQSRPLPTSTQATGTGPLSSSGRGNGHGVGTSSTVSYPSDVASGIRKSTDNAGTSSILYQSSDSSQPVQQSAILTHDTGLPLKSDPSSASQRQVEDDAPPAYDELRRKSIRAAEKRKTGVMNR